MRTVVHGRADDPAAIEILDARAAHLRTQTDMATLHRTIRRDVEWHALFRNYDDEWNGPTQLGSDLDRPKEVWTSQTYNHGLVGNYYSYFCYSDEEPIC